jgi:hypothetical protein
MSLGFDQPVMGPFGVVGLCTSTDSLAEPIKIITYGFTRMSIKFCHAIAALTKLLEFFSSLRIVYVSLAP